MILNVDNLNGRLQQHTPLRWRDICLAPCDSTVDPSALYRIGGGTSIASNPFRLPRATGDVYIDAHVGSKVTHFVGLGLMIGGLVAAGYGTFFWAASADPNGAGSHAERNMMIILFSASAVLEAVGLPMFLKSTTVQVR